MRIDFSDPYLGESLSALLRTDDYQRLRAAGRVQDSQERLALYQALDTDLVKQAAIIPLVYQRLYMLVKPWVAPIYENSPHLDRIFPYRSGGRHGGAHG